MENDSAPLYAGEAYSQAKVVTRHIDNEHADGMILVNQPTNQPPPAYTPMPLGPDNTITVCQHCHASVRTSVRHTTTTRTHMTAVLCALISCCCCCCIPYCMNSTKNSDHYCPNCAKYLGTYKK